MPSDPKKVFISYSHDSPEHEERVRAFADRLCHEGVDCNYDGYEPAPTAGWPQWIEAQIQRADYVLVVASADYSNKATRDCEPDRGRGVHYEYSLIRQHLYDEGIGGPRIIPVWFDGSDYGNIPVPLRKLSYFPLTSDADYDRFYFHITDQPRVLKPELGELRQRSPEPSPELFPRVAQPTIETIGATQAQHRTFSGTEPLPFLGGLVDPTPHGEHVLPLPRLPERQVPTPELLRSALSLMGEILAPSIDTQRDLKTLLSDWLYA
ncbi:MAG TPA: TIR domain-containing protein [Thermoanaerobaculia bacterium]